MDGGNRPPKGERGRTAFRFEPAAEEGHRLAVQPEGGWATSFSSEMAEKRPLQILQMRSHAC
jgi:hypothetical protein